MKTLDKKAILEKTDKPALFRELIPKFKETKQGQAVGLCPAHDDSNASLSIDTTTGAIHCFACDFKGGLIDVVMKVKGIDFKPALYWLAERAGIDTTQTTPKGKSRTVAAFYYTDAEGKRLYWKERVEPGKDGRKKEFIFYHLDKTGKKQTGRGESEAVPYRLHEIIHAPQVFIFEGEAKADLGAAWNLAATCLDSGSQSKMHPRYTAFFEGKEVVIVPDNDTAGEGYLETIATALYGKTKSLKVLRLPGLKEKGDILDWKAARNPESLQACKDAFLELVKEAQDWTPPAVIPETVPASKEPETDDENPNKTEGGRGSDRLLKMLSHCTLYHDDSGVAYILINKRLEPLDVKNKRLSAYLCYAYHKMTGKAPGREAISSTIQVLEGKALHEGACIELFNRIGEKDKAFYYDLGKGRCVSITAGKWEAIDAPPVFFRHFNHQQAHPDPVLGGDPWTFFEYCNLPEESRLLVMVAVIACFIPRIPHPVLHINGPQGSGKSSFCRLLKSLIDPSAAALLSLPRKEDELDLILYRHHFVTLDNLSDLSASLSDRLCGVITGATIEKRQLFTDTDTALLRCNPSVCVNGITPLIHRPDLLDRSLTITLERITPEERREEGELWKRFEEALPSMLGGVFDTLAKAIEIYPTVTLKSLPRLADFARWGFAIAEALGGRGHEFMRAYADNANLQTEELIDNNALFAAIMAYMESHEHLEGTFKEVLEKLTEAAKPGKDDKSFPATPRSLRSHLERIRVPLNDMNIIYQIKGKTARGKVIEFIKREVKAEPQEELIFTEDELTLED